jgi:hypothetical protein
VNKKKFFVVTVFLFQATFTYAAQKVVSVKDEPVNLSKTTAALIQYQTSGKYMADFTKIEKQAE